MAQNLKKFTDDPAKYVRYKAEHLLSLCMSPRRILDFGCGTGKASAFLREAFPTAELWGCDVSEESIRAAKENFPDADVEFFSIVRPEDLALREGNFDLVFISCVLHHIPPAERPSWMKALAATLSAKGKVAVFEHNPRNPITRHCVATCEFDTDAVLLPLRECGHLFAEAGLSRVSSQYTLFFPWRTPYFSRMERLLTWLPLGAQYCAVAEKKQERGN